MLDIKFKPLNIEEEIKKDKKTPNPYILEFRKGDKDLICFGVKHSCNFSEKQFEILLNYIKNSDAILIEANDLKKEYDNEIKFILANSNDKIIIPCDLNILKAVILVSNKFDSNDILLLRALLFLNKKERKENLRKYISQILDLIKTEIFFSEIYKKENFTEESFVKLLEEYLLKNNGKKIDEINENDNICPSPVEIKTELNKIIREISLVRDAHMLEELKRALKNYDNVLYILGKNHIIRQEETIKKIFASL